MDYFQDYNTELEALGTEPMGVSQDVHKDNLFKKSHAVDMEGTGMVERGLKTSFFDLWKAIRGYQEVHGHHPPFPQDEEKIKEAIFNSPHVQEAIRHFAIENSLTERHAHEKVRGMLDLMVAKFDSRVARSFEYVMTKVLRRLFVSIQVDERGLEMVKDIADTGVPIVLMPTHKSHIDYIVMSIICFHCNLSLPYIAAGDNLNIPVIGPLLRKAGAFFIRRQFGTDPLYAILFKEYVEQILRGGHMMEFFVEGGRSRSGKVLRPKMGLLSVIANAVMSQKIQDAVLIPISINYDKVVEGESYTKELLGANKTPESLMGVLKSAKLLKVKFGKVDVNFGTPISTARFLSRKEQQQFTKQSLTHTTDERTKPKQTNKQKETEAETEIQPEVEREEEDAENDDEKEMEAKETEEQNKATNTKDLLGEEPEPEVRRLIRALAYRVLYECNKVSMARPTALVATVLLTHHGRGISLSDLCSRVEQLCKEIVLRGGRVAGFNSGKGHSSLRLIENALAVLGSLVKHHKNLLEAVYEPIQRLELTFYKNSIVHWFVSEGMVALALYAAMKPSFRDLDNARVLKADILDRVKFISQLLKLVLILLSRFSLLFTLRSCLLVRFSPCLHFIHLFRNLFISHHPTSSRTLRSLSTTCNNAASSA
ncbi:Acyltransferase, variant, variant 2 [Balamuthia mandrillaris]